MNREAVLKFLQGILQDILCHSNIISEISEIITAGGVEKRFFTLLVTRLRQLSQLGVDAIKLEEFENIGGGLYSLHLSGKGFNIRILYSFLSERQPVLLLAFYERAGKAKTNYSPYIQPAKDRLQEMKEEILNGSYKI